MSYFNESLSDEQMINVLQEHVHELPSVITGLAARNREFEKNNDDNDSDNNDEDVDMERENRVKRCLRNSVNVTHANISNLYKRSATTERDVFRRGDSIARERDRARTVAVSRASSSNTYSVDTCKIKLNALQEELRFLKAAYANLRESTTERTMRLENSIKQQTSLSESSYIRQRELAEQVDAQKDDLARLRIKIEKYRSNETRVLDTLKRQIERTNGKKIRNMNEGMNEIARFVSEYASLHDTIRDCETERERLANEMRNAASAPMDVEEIPLNFRQAVIEEQRLTKELENRDRAIESLQNQLATLAERDKERDIVLETKNRETAVLKDRVNELNRLNMEQTTVLDVMQTETSDKSNKIDRLTSEFSQLQARLEKELAARLELQARLKTCGESTALLVQRLSKIDITEENVSERVREIKQMYERYVELTSKLNDAKTHYENMKNHVYGNEDAVSPKVYRFAFDILTNIYTPGASNYPRIDDYDIRPRIDNYVYPFVDNSDVSLDLGAIFELESGTNDAAEYSNIYNELENATIAATATPKTTTTPTNTTIVDTRNILEEPFTQTTTRSKTSFKRRNDGSPYKVPKKKSSSSSSIVDPSSEFYNLVPYEEESEPLRTPFFVDPRSVSTQDQDSVHLDSNEDNWDNDEEDL